MYRAVLLDFFNTLTTAVRRGPRHTRIARLLGCDPAAWIDILDRTFSERACGAHGRAAFGRAVDGLRALAEELGASPSRAAIAEAIEARIETVRDDCMLRPQAAPLLRTLRAKGLRTAVVSDCWFELPEFLPRLPIAPLVDTCVYSVQVGHTKPHPAMYLTACERLGVTPEQCLYIGDGGSRELSGAARLGMTAVRLAAPDLGTHLTFNAEPEPWVGPVITSLAEIPGLLSGGPVSGTAVRAGAA